MESLNGSHLRIRKRQIEYRPSPSQMAFHLSTARYKGFSGPVGSGKSFAFVNECLRLAYLNPGCPGVIAAPTYRMLSDVTRAAFIDLLDLNAVPYVFRKADNVIRLTEVGADVRFRSLDKPDRMRGSNLAWFGVDELTYCSSRGWDELVKRLRNKAAKVRCGFAVWTPKGYDWVHERFVGEPRPNHAAVRARPFENAGNLGDDYYESLRHTLDPRMYAQEVLGEYLAVFAGQAYYTFSRDDHVTPCAFNAQLRTIAWSLDFNIDPMCSIVAQVEWSRDAYGRGRTQIKVLDEIALPDARTVHAVQSFVARIKPWTDAGLVNSIELYGDASGKQNRSVALDSDWAIIHRELGRALPHVRLVRRYAESNPEVRTRVAAVCAQLRAADGEINIQINPKCRELIKDLDQVAWKRDMVGRPLDDLDKRDPNRTHMSDALGYLVIAERRPPGGPQSTALL